MSDGLIEIVLERASADTTLSESAKTLVLAALMGEEHVDDALAEATDAEASGAGRASDAGGTRADAGPGDTTAPARAYLSKVSVTGFRGIGPTATLSLDPGPGLTVVAGRNGCGKSSFAEALEVAFTRHSYRWSKRTAVWSESWRNLHHPDHASIVVELAEEGHGSTTVGAQWATDAGLDDVTTWAQRSGARREPVEALGWERDLDLFRPFLSYDELGALFAEPSKLHDALAGILGLDRLEDAVQLLTARAKTVAEPGTAATKLAKQLLPGLDGCPDSRATQAATLLRVRRPDLGAVSALVTGAAPADPQLTVLRSLALLQAPRLDHWHAAHGSLEATQARHTQALAAVGTAQLGAIGLLQAAVAHFAEHGEGPCPVCGRGTLDADWAQRARSSIDAAGLFADAVTQAEAAVAAARDALRRAIPVPPSPLFTAQLDDVPSLAPAAAAWAGLQAAAVDETSAAENVEALHQELVDAVRCVVDEAELAVKAREDLWQPLAVQVAEWLRLAAQAAATSDTVAQLKAAQKWLTAHTNELRNDRLAPLADRARAIWSLLRQESNVDLGALTLEGSNTRRRVELTATVDGRDAGAFGVMSQGELHALALALFLPRATAEDSPFGFIIIDDPVQAMDPAKVDGLAHVLHQTAQDRQVVVLTHDDRLPEAVRQLQIPARILEVTRDADSAVTVHESANPAQRYLSDAWAVAKDEGVPPDVVAGVVPELCRLALEATCRDAWFRARLLDGDARTDVEKRWTKAQTTRQRLALAVTGTPDASLDPWLADRRRKAALGVCTTAVHQGLKGNPLNAIEDVQAAVKDLAATCGR